MTQNRNDTRNKPRAPRYDVRFRNGAWGIFDKNTLRTYGPYNTEKQANAELNRARREVNQNYNGGAK